jgi:hypothetical protein
MAMARLESEFGQSALARELHRDISKGSARERMQGRILREPSIREAIDTACREWAKGHPWPMTDAETAVFLWDRVVEARVFGQWLTDRGARVDGDSGQEVLTWLLVDYWVLAGFYRWHARIWTMK